MTDTVKDEMENDEYALGCYIHARKTPSNNSLVVMRGDLSRIGYVRHLMDFDLTGRTTSVKRNILVPWSDDTISVHMPYELTYYTLSLPEYNRSFFNHLLNNEMLSTALGDWTDNRLLIGLLWTADPEMCKSLRLPPMDENVANLKDFL